MIAGGWFGGDLSIEASTVTFGGATIVDYGGITLDGGKLVATNDSTIIGEYMGGGIISIEDGLFLAREIFVGTEYQEGSLLAIDGGTTELSSYLQVGPSNGGNLSAGYIRVNGGQLVVTNGDIVVGFDSNVIVSDGLLAASYIDLNPEFNGTGSLDVNGGSITASTGITLGNCASNTFGYALVDGGQLIVTNAAHTAFIDVQNGQLALSNGVLRVDKLVMTNSCSSFIHTDGTLIVGSVVLDLNTFRIVSVTPQGKDMLVTWMMGPGATNTLQVASGDGNGNYATNGFTDIFIVTNNTTVGTLTNYLDIGAATNNPSRYYRARLAP
jgi:hypothetical protein